MSLLTWSPFALQVSFCCIALQHPATHWQTNSFLSVCRYLLTEQSRLRSVNDIMPMIGARFYTQLDASQMRNDVIEEDLAKVCEGHSGLTFKLKKKKMPRPTMCEYTLFSCILFSLLVMVEGQKKRIGLPSGLACYVHRMLYGLLWALALNVLNLVSPMRETTDPYLIFFLILVWQTK